MITQQTKLSKKKLGMVATCVHHSSDENAMREMAPAYMIERIHEGLPIFELAALQESLAVPMDVLAAKLGISKATLQRRKIEGRLDAVESERVLRFARLMGKGIIVFGSEDDAREWLNKSQFGLGGAVPLDYAETEIGAREVENLLGRIEYGVYS
ncbi:MAG: antitoxin Xre/MbcA/ParS toxin-binding domain-containing protein [Verrucomicrobiota bacterium]